MSTRRGDLSIEVQNSIFALLSQDAELNLYQEDRVFDNVPQNSTMPYTQIGDDTWEDGGDKTDDGREGLTQIHVYADERNYETLKKIMARINELLHDRDEPLVIAGGQVVTMRFSRSHVITDSNACTRHGIINFRISINQPRS